MFKRQWRQKKALPAELDLELADFDPIGRQLLANREILTKNEAQIFLAPDYGRDLRDPLAIKNIDRAVERILKAIRDKEKVIIHGDYDADGVCSSTILAEFFKAAGFENFELYIPDRFKDGYGLTSKSLDYILEKGATLVMTIDNGVSNYEEIKKAEAAGVNVIVIDHHVVPESPPPAYAIVDLYQEGETYPFREFAGTGVAFKLVSALLAKNSFNLVLGWEKWLLDLVAIGTVADMVALTDENRVMVHWGLEVLKKSRRPGIKALARFSGVELPKITSEDIAFSFAPRINVAGRLEHATLAGELLATQSPEEAEWLAGRLEKLNSERKEMTEKIVREVLEEFSGKDQKLVVCGGMDWPTGILGSAASRLSENLSLSVILWGKGESEIIKGSARSAGDINVRDLLIEAGEEMYFDVGGHPMASGFNLKEEYADEFEKRVMEAYEKMPKGENVLSELVLEKEMTLEDVNSETLGTISRFEPFGQGNSKPVFLFKNLLVERARVFGNGGLHLELKFKNSKNEIITAIGFWMAGDIESVRPGECVDLAASMENSTYRGYDELRLRIADFKKVS